MKEVHSQKEETNLSKERSTTNNCSNQKMEYKAVDPACMNGCLDLYPRHPIPKVGPLQ